MKRIYVYDIEAGKIDKLCEENGNICEAEIIEALFLAMELNDIDINDYM